MEIPIDNLNLTGRLIFICLFLGLTASFLLWINAVRNSAPANKKLLILVLIVLACLARYWVYVAVPASDDVNRYLWEGRLVLAGESPYEVVADDPSRAIYQDEIWQGMNHRDVMTVYPPLAQYYFAAAAWIWDDLRVFKLLAGLFEGLIFFFLWRWSRLQNKPKLSWSSRWSVLAIYALNPCILLSFMGEGHYDYLFVLSMVVMAYAWQRTSTRPWAWVALACAIQIKLVAVFFLPWLGLWILTTWIKAFNKRQWLKEWWWQPALAISLFFILWLPYLQDMTTWWEATQYFGKNFHGNSGLHVLLVYSGIEPQLANAWCIKIFMALVMLISFASKRIEHLMFMVLAALLMTTPLLTYWYLSWIVVFIAMLGIRKTWPLWLWTGVGVVYYQAYIERSILGIWQHPVWTLFLQWGIIALGLLIVCILAILKGKNHR